jgi:hypothetical protein
LHQVNSQGGEKTFDVVFKICPEALLKGVGADFPDDPWIFHKKTT